jgi:hypothetical protein
MHAAATRRDVRRSERENLLTSPIIEGIKERATVCRGVSLLRQRQGLKRRSVG